MGICDCGTGQPTVWNDMCSACNADYEDTLYERVSKIKLYEILVPTEIDRGKVGGDKVVPIRTRYHRVWDEKVREISGGLTVMRPASGQWVDDDGKLYKERMIPVRIACTETQIKEIAKFSLDFYMQKAVMCYEISENCFFIERD